MAFKVLNSISRVREQKILERIKKGDEKALALLYSKHYDMVVRVIVNNSGTEDEGKDVYQEALISLWKRVRSGELVIYSKISTYLYGVCMNLWKKELSRRKKFSYTNIRENAKRDPPESAKIGNQENKRIVADCLNEIGQTCKKILQYYYFDGRSMQEIADELGFANANTVKTRKYKCKQRLQKLVMLRYAKEDLLD